MSMMWPRTVSFEKKPSNNPVTTRATLAGDFGFLRLKKVGEMMGMSPQKEFVPAVFMTGAAALNAYGVK